MRRLVPFISAAAIVGIVSAVAYAFTGAAQFDPDAACIGNAKLLSQAVLQYEQNNGQHLPPTDSVASFHAALLPYVSNPSVFVCPATHLDYAPNPAVSGVLVWNVANSHTTAVFQDAAPHIGGKTIVAYVDGSVSDGSPSNEDVNQVCVDRAFQVGLGLQQYIQDNDEIYPPMHTPAEFEAAVIPYVKDNQDFVCPTTHKPFVPNASLSGVSLASIADPASTVAFSDPDAHDDGIKTVGYADGHVLHGNYHPSKTPPNGSMSVCNSYERQLALGVIQYAQDNDEYYPTYKTYAQFTAQVLPYVKNKSLFQCPDTGLNYELNPALNGVTLASLESPATTWYLRDAAPNQDGTVNVMMADGHIRTELAPRVIGLSVLPNNETRLLWQTPDGGAKLYTLDAAGSFEKSANVKPDTMPIIGLVTDTKLRTILLRGIGNTDTLQFLDANGNTIKSQVNGPYDGWDPIGLGIGPNWQGHLLWKRTDGQASVWTLRTDGPYMTDRRQGPVSGLKALSLASAPDNSQRLLWSADNGIPQVWTLDGGGNVLSTRTISPMPGWTPKSITVGSDNVARVLWTSAKHSMRIWKVPSTGVVDRSVFIQEGADWQPVGFGVGADGNYRALFAGAAGALVDVVNPNGTVISSNVLARP